MAQVRDTLENTVIEATSRLYRSSPKRDIEQWIHLDLTTAQIKTLAVLADDEPMTIGRVAELLGVTLPTASHLVEKLVRAGFAERHDDPVDRRRAVTRPSTRGTELIRGLREFNQSYLRACVSRMNDGDLAALAQGMNALADAAATLKDDPAWGRQPAIHKEPARV